MQITGGASGYLRQEFRELELLDEITRLRYEGLLPKHISGQSRNSIIRQFQQWKGTSYVPMNVHGAIACSQRDPFEKLHAVTDSPWQILKTNATSGYQMSPSIRSNIFSFWFLLTRCFT